MVASEAEDAGGSINGAVAVAAAVAAAAAVGGGAAGGAGSGAAGGAGGSGGSGGGESPGADSVAAGSSTAGDTNATSLKREAEAGDDGSGAAGRKRKKTGPGSRGVANLTPEQLAKKRANDREAQRAIRERTKNQIETLERRILDLTSQQPYQELQAVLRAKEAVEQENVEIKRRLAGIVALLQPLIGQASLDQAYASPSQIYTHPVQNSSTLSVQGNHNAAPTPGSASSPGSHDPSTSSWQQQQQQQHHHHQQHQQQQQREGSSTNDDIQARTQLSQQRHELRHGLDLGPERLGLDFLLDPTQRISRLQTGINGAQDTPGYHHVPMKHDWPGVAFDASFHARSTSNPSWGGSPPRSEPGVPDYATPVKTSEPTCPLDSLLIDFLNERRQRAADGLPAQEVVGPRYPSVSSLLNPAQSVYSHPLSKVFTDILSTFPDISRLPERVAVLYIMFLVMRWQIDPTQENYDRLPDWMTPRPSQLFTPHPAWVDHVPFPRMRDRLVRQYNPQQYLFDNFFVPFTTTLSLSWPYEDTDTLLQSPDGDELMINPVFERHLRNLDNWKLGESFAKTFPTLVDTFNLDTRRRGTSTPR